MLGVDKENEVVVVCRTLAQYLSQQDQMLSVDREREVLIMFQQIVAAIRHIHQHNILHRSLLTHPGCSHSDTLTLSSSLLHIETQDHNAFHPLSSSVLRCHLCPFPG